MAKNEPDLSSEYDGEEYEEEYDEEEYEEDDGGSWKRWAVIAAVGVVIICLGLAGLVYVARDTLLAPVAGLFATETPTPTNTLPATATATATLEPTATATLEPTATFTPSPTPLLLPPPEVMQIVDGPPVMSDQFDDNNRNWTALMEGSEYTIQQGMMVFRSGQPGKPAVIYCVTDCGPFEDRYFYQGELVDERGSEAGYGLTFGLDPQRSTYYVFMIRPSKSQFGLFKVAGQQIFRLIEWTDSPAILPAPQVNGLGARFLVNKIDLFINNTWVGEALDKGSPYKSGRVGLFVEQDGVRLLANQVKVFGLFDVTPEPPGQHPTAAPFVTPTQGQALPTLQQPPAGAPTAGTPAPGAPTAGAPTAGAPLLPTATLPPAPTARFTYTPTAPGTCGPGIPAGKLALVITKVGAQNRPAEVTINGVRYILKEANTVFYLDLNVNHSVQLGNKTISIYSETCKIIYKKVQAK